MIFFADSSTTSSPTKQKPVSINKDIDLPVPEDLLDIPPIYSNRSNYIETNILSSKICDNSSLSIIVNTNKEIQPNDKNLDGDSENVKQIDSIKSDVITLETIKTIDNNVSNYLVENEVSGVHLLADKNLNSTNIIKITDKNENNQEKANIAENSLNNFRSESPESLILSNDSYADDIPDSDFDVLPKTDSLPSLKLDSINNSPINSANTSRSESVTRKDEDSISGVDISNNDKLNSDETANTIDDEEIIFTSDNTETNLDVETLKKTKLEPNILAQTNLDSFLGGSADESSFRQILDDNCDDFIEYSSDNILQTPNADITVPPDEKFTLEEFNTFAADFSQFNESITVDSCSRENDLTNHFSSFTTDSSKNLNEIAIDDDDDFGDFEDVSPIDNFTKESVLPNASEKSLEVKIAESDDDFGDFSDFSQSQPSIPIIKTNIEHVYVKISLLLEMMFPYELSKGDCAEEAAITETRPTINEHLLNKTTSNLKNFDNAKALDYQWLTSVGKNSLVTALGIDLRNIVSLNFQIFMYNL